MLEHVNIDVLANWVMMLRADVDGAIWLSEDHEARFYERCAHAEARVVPAGELVLALLDKVEQRGICGVVATSRGTQPRRGALNVFQPSVGDVASLLLLSKSCDKVIRDIFGNAWLAACEKEAGPICPRVVWIARVLRRLREVCTEEFVPRFDDIDPSEIMDWNAFEPAWERLLSLVAGGCSDAALEQIRAMRPGQDLRSDLLECDGMDAVRIFSAATRLYRPRGIAASRDVDPDNLLSMLRVAFDLNELEDDEIFWQMKRWERANIQYPLLRAWRTLDPLGVVWDQRYWEPDFSAMLNMLRPGESLAIFKMDLDNFKQVNDVVGHAGGDDVIRVYCRVVRNVLGNVGEVYRRGGDEVIVLAPGLPEISARELAERTRSEIEAKLRDWSSQRNLGSAPTASIGLVVTTGEKTRSELIRLIDDAQRQAKQQGKNRVVFTV